MKTTISIAIVLLTLISSLCQGQVEVSSLRDVLYGTVPANHKKIDGFWGVKFGSSYMQAKKIILSKEGAILDKKNSDSSIVVVDAAKFAGRQTSYIVLQFINDKFHTAVVSFKSDLEAKVVDLYETMETELNEKYFKTDSDFKNFKYPYKEGDGYEITAIKVGKATFASFWNFPREDGFTNSIYLTISENLLVKLRYQDGKLIEEAVEIQKSKNAKDY